MTRFANNITLVGTLMLTVTMLAVAGGFGTVHAALTRNVTTNLALRKPAAASSVGVASQKASKAVDGTATTKWASAITEVSWLMVDLRHRTSIGRYRVVHADPFETWQRSSINLRDFDFQVSNDAKHWITVDTVTNNVADITDHTVELNGRYRYVRLYVTDPQTEQLYRGARIFEFEVYP